MNAYRMLRFKIVTSFVIALLGALMFTRLAFIEPFSLATSLPFAIAAAFFIAGLWRARIYLRALQDFGKALR
jgi:hypothetical protein